MWKLCCGAELNMKWNCWCSVYDYQLHVSVNMCLNVICWPGNGWAKGWKMISWAKKKTFSSEAKAKFFSDTVSIRSRLILVHQKRVTPRLKMRRSLKKASNISFVTSGMIKLWNTVWMQTARLHIEIPCIRNLRSEAWSKMPWIQLGPSYRLNVK